MKPSLDMKDRGSVALEFALLAPIFFMLVFGITEFGRLRMAQNMLTQAAREGARYAAVTDDLVTDDSRVDGRIRDFLNNSSLTDVVISTTPASGPGDLVTVIVNGTFHVVSGNILPGFSGDVALQAQCSFRYER